MTPETLKSHINQCREFADVLDEEGMDRDGLHFAIYAVIEAAESTLALRDSIEVWCNVEVPQDMYERRMEQVFVGDDPFDAFEKGYDAALSFVLTQISALRGKEGAR